MRFAVMIKSVRGAFSEDELDQLFDPSSHLGVGGEIVDEAIALARKLI